MSEVLNLPNSIWPNGIKVDDEGYAVFYPLGTNKIEVPTDSSSWPTGDKLVSPFVYQNDRLVGFCDTMAMTVSGNTTITMPYEHIEADFASISEGKLTVNAPNAVVKKFSWSVVDSGDDNVVITLKYKGCKTVADVRSVDPDYLTNDIVDGVWSEGLGDLEEGYYTILEEGPFGSEEVPYGMFHFCNDLKTFSSDLSSLTDGESMFSTCRNLTTFSSNLSSLTSGVDMFYNTNLTSFNSDLPSLTSGIYLFYHCSNLTSFNADLSSLTNGDSMFYGCSNLTSFNADLSSLTYGGGMFDNCKLDAQSIKKIIDAITMDLAGLTLGMGCNDTIEDKNLFAQEAGYSDMDSLLAALQAKTWHIITVQYNGRPTTTYSLRRPSAEDTLPVFVKLEEVEETEKHADYTSEDGSKKYRLNWFHETTGSTEVYTQFNSLEEAIEHFNIKPIERN